MARPKSMDTTEQMTIRFKPAQMEHLRAQLTDATTYLRNLVQKDMDQIEADLVSASPKLPDDQDYRIPKPNNRIPKTPNPVIPSDKRFMDEIGSDPFPDDDPQASFDEFPARELE